MKIIKFKLFSKIFLSFFILVLLIVAAISTTSYFSSSALLEDGVNDKLNILVQEKGNMLQEIVKSSKATGTLLSTNADIVNYLCSNSSGNKSVLPLTVSQYLSEALMSGNGLYENIFIAGTDGKILLDGISGTSIGTDINGMDFFEAAKKGTQALSKVMVSPVTGRPVVVVGTPAFLGGETIGITAVAIEFDVLTKPVIQSKIGSSGFTFIINKEGVVLAHLDKDLVMKMNLPQQEGSLGELGRRMTQEAQGIGTYTDNGSEKIVSFRQIPDSEFVIASAVEAQEVYAPIKSLLSKSIIIGITALVLALASALVLARNLTTPVKKLATAVQKAAKGDFTYQLNINRNDELGELTYDFQTMQSEIKNMIEHITSASQYVADTSQGLSSNTQEATKSTDQVATAIEQIAAGSEEQSQNATDTLKITEQVIQAIDQIATGAQDQSKNVVTTSTMVADMASKIQTMAEGMLTVKDFSEQNGQAATEGGKIVQMTVNGMVSVKNATTDTATKINELGEQSQKIGDIIQVIDEIAEQTNLLALNAAIEAARAGEQGKGFAVVADEVRKLAERSSKATKEIADLITDMQRGTKLAVESMQVGSKEVENGVNLAQKAGESLYRIVDGVKKAGIKVHEIMELIDDVLHSSQEVTEAVNNVASITEENSAATQEMAASSEQVNISMQNVAGISEENAASSEEVSESAKNLKISIQGISTSSTQLASMAQELQHMVGEFKI